MKIEYKHNSGMSIFGWTQLSFIIMKVAGVIEWSWWKVFIPVYIWILLLILLIIIEITD